MNRPSLQELGVKHGTEKATLHSYLPDYQSVLDPLRDEPITLLEIGIGWGLPVVGASLRMWAEFFPLATVLGADCYYCGMPEEPRVVVLPPCRAEGPLLPHYLKAWLRGGLLDVIVDDASHVAREQHETFDNLKGLLGPGGLYFVEDIQHQDEIAAWQGRPEYVRHWARRQEGPGGPRREDDVLVMLRA